MKITFDVELTNRCNARCHFCPRDATPLQGMMTPSVFSKTVDRIIELRELVSDLMELEPLVVLCGLGEPLLNPGRAGYVRQVRLAGFDCVISSNGALLSEKVGRALLDAGLQGIYLNVSDRDQAYERVYGLPFERTRDNVLRFAEMAGDRCDVFIVVVDYLGDRAHVHEMMDYWRTLGIRKFIRYDLINRGGSLHVDDVQYGRMPHVERARGLLTARGVEPVCGAPFIHLFVGFDGEYYLCSSDWKKEVALGNVVDTTVLSITRRKLEHVACREPICKSCTNDPTNRLAAMLYAVEEGEAKAAAVDALIDQLIEDDRVVRDMVERMDRAGLTRPACRVRRIPLSVG